MVLRVMKSCERKLKMLEDVVDIAKNATTKSKMTRTFGSFKLACKKKDLEGFESQLYDAVSLLNLTITTNLTTVRSETMGKLMSEIVNISQLAAMVTKELVLLRTSQMQSTAQDKGVVLAEVRQSPKISSASQDRYVTISKCCGMWGSFVKKRSQTILKSDQSGQNVEAYSRSETAWIFIPSFFSRCVEVKYFSTFGSVQRSLRTYPLLPRTHPIWDMCMCGNLKGVQTLLSEGQVSPFSVNRVGQTLLHFSSFYGYTEMCKFLLDLGLSGQEKTINGFPTSVDLPSTINAIHRSKHIFSLFASKFDDFDATEVCFFVFSSRRLEVTVEVFNDMVRHFISKDTINMFYESPILMAMRLLWTSDPGHSDAWKQAIRHLIDLGADLHKSSHNRCTLLDDILNMAIDPYESVDLGREWLDTLQRAGVDVVEYLRSELRCYEFDDSLEIPMMEPQSEHGYHERYLVIFEEPPKVSWEWFIDQDGAAFDVLEEFKNFGPGFLNFGNIFHKPESARNWNWPISYPKCHYYGQYRERGLTHKEYIAIATAAKARFERRQYKKAMKLARAQGLARQGLKMPGGWID